MQGKPPLSSATSLSLSSPSLVCRPFGWSSSVSVHSWLSVGYRWVAGSAVWGSSDVYSYPLPWGAPSQLVLRAPGVGLGVFRHGAVGGCGPPRGCGREGFWSASLVVGADRHGLSVGGTALRAVAERTQSSLAGWCLCGEAPRARPRPCNIYFHVFLDPTLAIT